MSTRTIYILIFIVLFAMGVLFLTHFFSFAVKEKIIDPNEVESSAVIIDGTHYPLNFEQHCTILSMINHAEEISLPGYQKEKEAKLILYRFNNEPLHYTLD